MTDGAWLWTDRIGIVIGLVLAIPVLWTWWQVVFGDHRKRRRWLREVSRRPGKRPGALIVDCLPQRDIATCVQHYLADAGLDSLIPADRRISIQRNEALTAEDIDPFARDILDGVAKLLRAGVDVIHVFFAGPGVAALVVGAHLRNGPRCTLYHYEQGRYLPFGPLEPLRLQGTTDG